MTLYTGYYAKISTYRRAGLIPISISRYTPNNVCVQHYFTELAPSSNLLYDFKNGNCTEDEYATRYYRETLSNIDVDNLLSKLNSISPNGSFVLLCYEKSGDFCHRNLLARFLRQHGIVVEEFGY